MCYNGAMKITKFEQSGFIIETNGGYRLAVDIGSYTPTDKLNDQMIDAMLVSHIHGDHFSLEQIKKLKPKKLYLNRECIEVLGEESLESEIIQIAAGDSIDIYGLKVLIFNVDHGPNTKIKPQENFGFLIEADGEKLYFAGDMFYPSGLDIRPLVVDYALIPVGTFYTFGPAEALDFAKQFKKIGQIIPMHYEKIEETKDEFIKLANSQGLVTVDNGL